jgi:hypothetical protein
MESVRLISQTAGSEGEEWRLKRTRKGLVLLDEYNNVVTTIRTGEAGVRVLFPNGFNRSHIVIEAEGAQLLFEARPRTLEKVRAMVEECVEADPLATAKAYRGKAIRDLIIGALSLVFGVTVTLVTILLAEGGRGSLILTGFIVVGLIEIVRGSYFAYQAHLYYQKAPARDDDDDEDEGDDDDHDDDD